MPRISPASDRELVRPLAAALATVGVDALRHPLAPDVVATVDAEGGVEPAPFLATLPAAIRGADRAREAERTARTLWLVLVGALLPVGGALAGRALVPLIAVPVVVGLAGGAVVGAVAAWRSVARELGALLDPTRATSGVPRRLADEALRTRALAAWGEDGPLVTAAIATAREALAARPAHDDPEDWDALALALAEAEEATVRARSRVGGLAMAQSAMAQPTAAQGAVAQGAAAQPAAPATPASPAPAPAEPVREFVVPAPPVLSDEQRALLAKLDAIMPVRAAATQR